VVYTASKSENFEREGDYCSKRGICQSVLMFSESKSLVIGSCSVEKVYYQVVNVV
jgi:hypothetical protein